VADEAPEVEVAYALPERQMILRVPAEAGMTVGEAIERSGIREHFPEIDLSVNKVGLFGKASTLDAEVRPGDRVEIYRPLIADPKEARKQRAARRQGEAGRSPAGDEPGPEEGSEGGGGSAGGS
jgi:putative ubiquitin-RnfH superfamily antitoxin RatB of RatAB toxin-antitoxin module